MKQKEQLKELGRKFLRDHGMENKEINIVWYSGWPEGHLGASQIVNGKKAVGVLKNPQRVANGDFEEIVVILNDKLKEKERKAKKVFVHELLHVVVPVKPEEIIHDLTDSLFEMYGEVGA